MNSLDGVMNMYARMLILGLLDGRISPARMGRLLERMVEDAGIEGILRSHMVLDNHDLPRIASILPEDKRHLAFHLQFTLPGAPVVYYGSELGMEGGNDPLNRAPMRWDLLRDDNPTWMLLQRLVKLREENPALRIGDFRILDGERLLAFLRTTDRARESLIVVVNPSHEHRHELLPVRDSRLMDAARVQCLLTGDQRSMHCGTIEVDLPAFSCRIYRTLDQGSPHGYSAFKRVR
jgi:glycosidase